MEDFLRRKGLEVQGYSRGAGFNVLDINQLRRKAKQCEFIYHFAAEAKPGESLFRPVETIEENIKGTLNVLEICREFDIPLIYPSSCEIYGDSNTLIDETHPLCPTNPYAASKAALDRICYMYFKCYGVDVKILRLFNPYGPRQQLNKVVTTFCLQAKRNQPLSVYGDGSDTRDYVYISDVIDALWLSTNAPSGEAINVATGKATSTLDLARLIISLTISNSDILFVDYPKAFGGIRRQVGSWKKAKVMLGWSPQVSLEEGVKRTLHWLE